MATHEVQNQVDHYVANLSDRPGIEIRFFVKAEVARML